MYPLSIKLSDNGVAVIKELPGYIEAQKGEKWIIHCVGWSKNTGMRFVNSLNND